MSARYPRNRRRAPLAVTALDVDPEAEAEEENSAEAVPVPTQSLRDAWNAGIARRPSHRPDPNIPGLIEAITRTWSPAAVEIEQRFAGGRWRRRWIYVGMTYVDVSDLL